MKVGAVSLVVLAVLISVVPQFTSCESQGRMLTLKDGRQVSMKCNWTARAELGIGLPLIAVGTTMFFSRRKETRRYLGLVGATLGALAILLPTGLIGVCSNPDMTCLSTMKPATILIGAVVVGASLAAVGISLGRDEFAGM